MKVIFPLKSASRTTLYVTDTTPILGVDYGSQLPDGTVLLNHNEKTAYDISGLYLVDYTLGDRWCEGSVIVAK
jgi:hypothetical protein